MAIIDQRIISGKGILLAPRTNPDVAKAKVLTLTAQLVRPATNQTANATFNPPRLLYARISASRNGAMLAMYDYQQDPSCWDFHADISAQSLYAIKCAYSGILETFVNLGAALGISPSIPVDNIESWGTTLLFPDTFYCVVNADGAVQLTLESIPFEICPDDTSLPTQPTNLPTPPTPVAQGVAIPPDSASSISLPYNPPNDDGNTVPYKLDQNAPTHDICFRIHNTGLESGSIIFENFVCAVSVNFPDGPPFDGQATFGIVAINHAGVAVINNPQAGLRSGTFNYTNPPNSSVRQPENSFGNCDSCAI